MFIFASRDSMQPSTTTTTPTAPRRQSRYSRSSTTSVTQLLSDSCSSLLHRLTSRVRGPSSTVERSLGSSTGSNVPGTSTSTSRSHHHHHHHHHHRHRDESSLAVGGSSSARSRLEEKYSSILERKPSFLSSSRQNLRRTEREGSPFVREERTLEPSARRSVLKSPSTILLSEKAYPYVSPVRREKTPCGHERRAHRARRTRDEAGRSNK